MQYWPHQMLKQEEQGFKLIFGQLEVYLYLYEALSQNSKRILRSLWLHQKEEQIKRSCDRILLFSFPDMRFKFKQKANTIYKQAFLVKIQSCLSLIHCCLVSSIPTRYFDRNRTGLGETSMMSDLAMCSSQGFCCCDKYHNNNNNNKNNLGSVLVFYCSARTP